MSDNKLISLIIPLYNEEANLEKLYFELTKVIQPLPFNFEFIFINDGSTDQSFNIVKKLSKSDNRIKYIEFSRNFGKELATSAGLKQSKGDCAIIVDADLQHPPALIPEFINKWQQNNDIVVGIREKNKGEGWIKQSGSFFFYKIMNLISETKILPRETDFRLIDRQVIDEFNKFNEKNRITRVLIDWLGFKREYVKFTANKRFAGKANYGFCKLMKLAFNSFITHSLFPLKLAGYLGVIITIFSSLVGMFMLVEMHFLHDPLEMHFSNMAQISILILFLMGVFLCSIGLIALYIGNIHQEVNNRPLYIIKKKNNFDTDL
ncbi:glycosyltransferase family 2 protein [Candidatus Falkowbacteria bacterium]|jgi:polyisoprenyl-phosphate glycosyltransferase|nr:glycosyltransferase family 2 protein [Candidatus Falkowbacteria bacterium]MBT6573474.1 glycosyltransferase family 2 protein [Candidatus Falkowbacteria bacterium]MBT7501141.1 glycosyltransferase family 2 protein [Candidatus Falkowbacteria bacterium]